MVKMDLRSCFSEIDRVIEKLGARENSKIPVSYKLMFKNDREFVDIVDDSGLHFLNTRNVPIQVVQTLPGIKKMINEIYNSSVFDDAPEYWPD